MADGPTVIETRRGGGGTAVTIVILAVAVIVGALIFTGVINFGGSGSRNVDVDVNLPKVEAPSAPAAPAAPAGEAPAAPAAPAQE